MKGGDITSIDVVIEGKGIITRQGSNLIVDEEHADNKGRLVLDSGVYFNNLKLLGADIPLQALFFEALSYDPLLHIIEVRRSVDRQKYLLEKGRTWTMKSKHLYSPSWAVDYSSPLMEEEYKKGLSLTPHQVSYVESMDSYRSGYRAYALHLGNLWSKVWVNSQFADSLRGVKYRSLRSGSFFSAAHFDGFHIEMCEPGESNLFGKEGGDNEFWKKWN